MRKLFKIVLYKFKDMSRMLKMFNYEQSDNKVGA